MNCHKKLLTLSNLALHSMLLNSADWRDCCIVNNRPFIFNHIILSAWRAWLQISSTVVNLVIENMLKMSWPSSSDTQRTCFHHVAILSMIPSAWLLKAYGVTAMPIGKSSLVQVRVVFLMTKNSWHVWFISHFGFCCFRYLATNIGHEGLF